MKKRLTFTSYAMIGLGSVVCLYVLFSIVNDLRSARASAMATGAQNNVLRAVSTVTPVNVFLVPTATAEAQAGATPVLMTNSYEVKIP